MKKLFLVLFVCFVYASTLICQKAPASFGKLDIEDLKMTVYDKDTSAAAVVLCDYGWFDLNTFTFTRLYRVKILKKAGYDLANFKYMSGEKPAVRGITYNLVDNKVVKEKLASGSVFTKNVGNSCLTTLAMPGIKEGSVFDIEVRYFGLPYEWYFQSYVPVRHSELVIPTSPNISFSKNFFGYIPLSVSTMDRWVSEDVPAFKSEPYINSSENYISKFEIDIKSISTQTRIYTFTTTWDAVNYTLISDADFPANNTPILCLSSIIDDLKKSGKSGDELMKDAFEAVKKMGFNGESRLYVSDEGICNHFKAGSGNSAEVNFALLQILKKLGFEAYPVAISTRGNGILSQFNPSLNKFNYVLVAVKANNSFTLLDATEKYMPYYLLPDRAVNENGRIIASDNNSGWIPLVSKGVDFDKYEYDLTLNDDLTLTGTYTEVFTDYAAADFRKYYASFNSKDEYARTIEKDYPGVIINDINITDIEDIYKPVVVTCDVTIEGMTTQSDDEIYINPMLLDQVKESPFNAAERVYPINYSRLKETAVNVRIKIPENYSVNILPKLMTSKTRNSTLFFSYKAASADNVVEISSDFKINALTITQDQYKDVRNVYNNMVSKHAEPIILKAK